MTPEEWTGLAFLAVLFVGGLWVATRPKKED